MVNEKEAGKSNDHSEHLMEGRLDTRSPQYESSFSSHRWAAAQTTKGSIGVKPSTTTA
jgi:hypothetical protein